MTGLKLIYISKWGPRTSSVKHENIISVAEWKTGVTLVLTSTGIDADASKGKSWPGYSWQQSGLMLKMWDTGFISTPCHCYLSMINWIMTNLHVVIPMESDGP